jgi:hypothetical protein
MWSEIPILEFRFSFSVHRWCVFFIPGGRLVKHAPCNQASRAKGPASVRDQEKRQTRQSGVY